MTCDYIKPKVFNSRLPGSEEVKIDRGFNMLCNSICDNSNYNIEQLKKMNLFEFYGLLDFILKKNKPNKNKNVE